VQAQAWQDSTHINSTGSKVNIDNLTLGELKKIAAMFGATQPQAAKQAHPFVGEYVIARCCSAGVHAGVVVSVDGENVILANSRRLWSWQAKGGIALSGVAQHGIKTPAASSMLLTRCCT
jgi:hypothetical protein